MITSQGKQVKIARPSEGRSHAAVIFAREKNTAESDEILSNSLFSADKKCSWRQIISYSLGNWVKTEFFSETFLFIFHDRIENGRYVISKPVLAEVELRDTYLGTLGPNLAIK